MTQKVKNKKPVTRKRSGRVKVTAQGQVSIPRQVMREAGIAPGDRLLASVEDGRIIFVADEDPLLALAGSAPAGTFDGAQEALRRMRDEEWDR